MGATKDQVSTTARCLEILWSLLRYDRSFRWEIVQLADPPHLPEATGVAANQQREHVLIKSNLKARHVVEFAPIGFAAHHFNRWHLHESVGAVHFFEQLLLFAAERRQVPCDKSFSAQEFASSIGNVDWY